MHLINDNHTQAIVELPQLRPGNAIMLHTADTVLHGIVERVIASTAKRSRRVIVRTHTSKSYARRYQLREDHALGDGFKTIAMQRSVDQLPYGFGKWQVCAIDLLT